MPRKLLALSAASITALVLAATLGLVFGSVHVPSGSALWYVWAEMAGGHIHADELPEYRIIVESRLPRVLTGIVVGAGLSLVGIVVQAMVRNPLADPYVLGISSGASVGATAVVLFGVLGALGPYAMPLAAFAGALVATAAVYLLARDSAGLAPLRLVLMGTALAYGFSAITTVLIFLAPAGDAARNVMFWLLGSLAAANWHTFWLVAVAVAAGAVLTVLCAERLNALAMGDDVAASLGVDAPRFRLGLFVLTALITGIVVSACGAIGFVGLVLPHVARLLVGADHRALVMLTPLLGAVFLVLADLIARTLVPPYELPIGAITAAVGAPVFLLLMRRKAVG